MERKNKGLVFLVIVLIILVVALSGYIVYDKMLNNTADKENINNIVENNQNIENNNSNVILKNQQEASLNNITVKVEDGNINFSSGNKNKIFSSVNAKYIYLVPYMDVSNVRLYYITYNNELYYQVLFPFEKSVFFDKEITSYGVKIADNVVGFIGNQSAINYDSEGKETDSSLILNVLLNDGTVLSVGYESN